MEILYSEESDSYQIPNNSQTGNSNIHGDKDSQA